MQVCPTVYMCFVYMEKAFDCSMASQEVVFWVLWDHGVSEIVAGYPVPDSESLVVSNTLDSLFSIKQGAVLNQRMIYCFT